ncbi:MAG: hypothetical protein FJY29_10055 [Betaproteobacteria bacterium]|nr:hypothetical protein [Betaproteobacteria bacterium]
MTSRWTSLVALSLAALALIGCGQATSPEGSQTLAVDSGGDDGFEPYKNERFSKALSNIFANGSDGNTRWSVSIRAYGPRGQKLSLYRQSAERAVKPASTMKILTSWIAFQKIPSASTIGSDKYSYIREMMKYSDNTMAENILGWCGGVSASYSMLTNFGISKSAQLNIADGSGLSYHNRLAADDLVQILSGIRASAKMKAFRSLLPVAGVDGTLAGRLGNVNGTIAAKTGTLINDPTAALAGYGDSRTGWQIVFAILGDSVPSVDSGRASIDSALTEVISTLNYLPASSSAVAAN